jgi:alpha-beta hydrolase superfamily lysophospholipase
MRRLLPLVLSIVVHGCGGPSLEPWHTERLTEEFTAARVGEVRTFDDYLQLEDRLLRELDDKVYAQVETGPAYALVRYSAGSLSDPHSRQPDWNRSFELKPKAPVGGVLLLHGMSDSPYTLRSVGEALERHGYWVVGLRLPGHGTAPSGLRHVTWADMAAAVRLAMEHLAVGLGGRPIHMVGFSTGGALALDFALDAEEGNTAPLPASLVLISPAIRIHPGAALVSFKDGLSVLPGLERLAWAQILPEFDPYRYNSFATNAGDVVHRVTTSVDRRVATRARSDPHEVLPPTLVLKSSVDASVTTEAAVDSLLMRLTPERHELVLFDLNRAAAATTLLTADPGPLTGRLMAGSMLPFAVTFITNKDPGSWEVVARRKPSLSTEVTEEDLGLEWPRGVISLSHMALPVAPADPLYGAQPPQDRDVLFLGNVAIRGERGVLRLPADWLLRMRYNPFYAVLERFVLEWVDRHDGNPLPASVDGERSASIAGDGDQ